MFKKADCRALALNLGLGPVHGSDGDSAVLTPLPIQAEASKPL